MSFELRRAGVASAWAVALTWTCAAPTIGAAAAPASGTAPASVQRHAATRASAARVVRVHDEGRLRFVRSSGSRLIDEGFASGSVPGRTRVQFVYNGAPAVTAQFTVYAAGGSFSGEARARLSNPTSVTPSFRGRLKVSSGSGRYAHASGEGELFGVFNRRDYGLTVQAIATLSYGSP